MFAAWNAWLHWGVDSQTEYTLKRKILHTNIAAVVAMLSLLFYHSVLLFFQNSAVNDVIIAELPFYAPLALIPWLNRKGWDGLARWSLAFSCIVSQLFSIFVAFGSMMNVHYYFILFAIVPIAFFPLREWLSIVFLFVLNIGLFLGFEFNWVEPASQILLLDIRSVQILRGMYETSTFLTMLLFIWMVEVIAERNENELEKMAVTDVLTGLPNRRFFEISFKLEAAKSGRSKEPLALALLDIDRFKQVNDCHGHEVGDEVLIHVARQLSKATRAANVVARVGGEEFAILLPNTTAMAAKDVAERIRQAVETADYGCVGESMRVTVSIGVCIVDCDKPLALSYKRADDALYMAKNGGRNRVVLCDGEEPGSDGKRYVLEDRDLAVM